MLSHITVGITDLAQAGAFYDAVLLPLGWRRPPPGGDDGGPDALEWVPAGAELPTFFAHLPFNGEPASPGNGSMVAFLAASPAIVEACHKAGLAAGGTDEGAPGPRPHYGAGYYGAYLRDPDGNKLHIVHRGDLGPR